AATHHTPACAHGDIHGYPYSGKRNFLLLGRNPQRDQPSALPGADERKAGALAWVFHGKSLLVRHGRVGHVLVDFDEAAQSFASGGRASARVPKNFWQVRRE